MSGFLRVYSWKQHSAVVSPVSFDDADDAASGSHVDAALGGSLSHGVHVFFIVYLLVKLNCSAGTNLEK